MWPTGFPCGALWSDVWDSERICPWGSWGLCMRSQAVIGSERCIHKWRRPVFYSPSHLQSDGAKIETLHSVWCVCEGGAKMEENRLCHPWCMSEGNNYLQMSLNTTLMSLLTATHPPFLPVFSSLYTNPLHLCRTPPLFSLASLWFLLVMEKIRALEWSPV